MLYIEENEGKFCLLYWKGNSFGFLSSVPSYLLQPGSILLPELWVPLSPGKGSSLETMMVGGMDGCCMGQALRGAGHGLGSMRWALVLLWSYKTLTNTSWLSWEAYQDWQSEEFSSKTRSKRCLNWTSEMQGQSGGCQEDLTGNLQRSQDSHIFQNLWWSKGLGDRFRMAAESTASHHLPSSRLLHYCPIHIIILASLSCWSMFWKVTDCAILTYWLHSGSSSIRFTEADTYLASVNLCIRIHLLLKKVIDSSLPGRKFWIALNCVN